LRRKRLIGERRVVQVSAAEQAAQHRARLAGVMFVAITGSCGKTTAKHLASAILERSLSGTVSPGSLNCGDPVVENVLRVSPHDDFCLQELGAWGPGTLDAGLALIRPEIGVVLNIRRDHFSAFRGLASTRAEKAKVVTGLQPAGTAVLNADDVLVREMGSMTAARTLSFGRSSDADLRATDVSARWPDRMSFRLSYDGADYRVRTRLIGEQSLGSALAALAIAVALGVPIESGIQRLGQVDPLPRRMSSVTLPDGITFIRDDFKAPSDSMIEVIEFMTAARADRKVAVIGRISDCPGRSRRAYTECARAAASAVDEVAFVGERAYSLWGSSGGPWEGERAAVSVFRDVKTASLALNARLQPGDLVLLKGSGPADHMERILHARTGEVRCWLSDCGRVIACDECERLRGLAAPDQHEAGEIVRHLEPSSEQ
jgi:UDP-N-acetylmuramoyl-tripeptide--D-alanyl-D-alanine ligase